MEPDETTLISGRIIAEFEDDASEFVGGEAEFTRTPEMPAAVPTTPQTLPTNGAIQGKAN